MADLAPAFRQLKDSQGGGGRNSAHGGCGPVHERERNRAITDAGQQDLVRARADVYSPDEEECGLLRRPRGRL